MRKPLDHRLRPVLLLATGTEASPVRTNCFDLGMVELNHGKSFGNRVVLWTEEKLIEVNEGSPDRLTMAIDVMLIRCQLVRLGHRPRNYFHAI